ncbi:hypothetical protein AUC69_14325 [Methyloceanibacter superfactus]|uniref:Uncharacterized protein n=1 Tax=Methyloceanibacter superfactus TaxID=1774969 RepID=A0A1E3VTB4_9HYPH|nr:hypothetical protein AUC69_14325 [Methyloceanibacter superfactus]
MGQHALLVGFDNAVSNLGLVTVVGQRIGKLALPHQDVADRPIDDGETALPFGIRLGHGFGHLAGGAVFVQSRRQVTAVLMDIADSNARPKTPYLVSLFGVANDTLKGCFRIAERSRLELEPAVVISAFDVVRIECGGLGVIGSRFLRL